MVRSMKVLKMFAGSLTGEDLKPGTSGKLSRSTPAMRKLERSHLTVTQLFSSLRKTTGASGSTRAMSKSLRAPTHIEPGVLISASASQRSVTSRSVPMMRIVFSPTDSISMFERIGIVFFFSTVPCTKPSSFCRVFLLIVNSIPGNSSQRCRLRVISNSIPKRLFNSTPFTITPNFKPYIYI